MGNAFRHYHETFLVLLFVITLLGLLFITVIHNANKVQQAREKFLEAPDIRLHQVTR